MCKELKKHILLNIMEILFHFYYCSICKARLKVDFQKKRELTELLCSKLYKPNTSAITK